MIRKENGAAVMAIVGLMFTVMIPASADAPIPPVSGSAGSTVPPVSKDVPGYTPKGPIEAKNQVQGPWAVSQTVSTEACDREQRLCDIWYPSDLGANPLPGQQDGFKHPVIAWANGSGQTPAVYAYYLQHLASWGFIVVASRDDQTGDGGTTADAATYIFEQDKLPSSVFHDKVDTTNVGAAGHSQGGAAIANLHAHASPIFTTYVGFRTAPGFFAGWCCGVTPDTYAGSAVSASIFQWSSTSDSGTPDWYDAVPETAQKAYARLEHTHHGDIGGNPGCLDAGCGQGAYGYLGYSTAWLMWQLQGAADGKAPFEQEGEFFRPEPNWSQSLSNVW
ncbi:hypothetical protein AB0H49_22500 [Nocardia sp. NPDC050713]|uniref:hypothetical protein n=1 Tax=Nocardia sp. NPDC050713 TaxID=3154511 RepID=UPI0033CC05D3